LATDKSFIIQLVGTPRNNNGATGALSVGEFNFYVNVLDCCETSVSCMSFTLIIRWWTREDSTDEKFEMNASCLLSTGTFEEGD